MTRDLLIALALGLVAAIAMVSATTGPLPVRLIFFLITPLPLMLAGLGWGVRGAVIAGLAGAAFLLIAGPIVAAVFVCSQAVPAAVLTYLAMLNRPAAALAARVSAVASTEPAAQPAPQTALEWYPAGRLVTWAAILAAVPAFIWAMLADANSDELKAALTAALEQAFKAGTIAAPGGGPWLPDDIARVSAAIYTAMPGATALAWMSGLLLTLWLAGRIMRASGQLLRPWPDLAALEFPSSTALAFAAVILLAFVDGPVGIAGRALLGALLLAYLLMGLAVIHSITRGLSWRPFALWTLYSALLFVSGLAAVPIVALGFFEQFVQLRRRQSNPPGSSST